jgi:hypothetical protein
MGSYIPEDGILHSHHRVNLKSYIEWDVYIGHSGPHGRCHGLSVHSFSFLNNKIRSFGYCHNANCGLLDSNPTILETHSNMAPLSLTANCGYAQNCRCDNTVVTALRVLASDEFVWRGLVVRVFPTPALLDNGILSGDQKLSRCICYNTTNLYGLLPTEKSQVHRDLHRGRFIEEIWIRFSLLLVPLFNSPFTSLIPAPEVQHGCYIDIQ